MAVRVASGIGSFVGALILTSACGSADGNQTSQTSSGGTRASEGGSNTSAGHTATDGGTSTTGGTTATGGVMTAGGRAPNSGGGSSATGGAFTSTGGDAEGPSGSAGMSVGGSDGSTPSAEHCTPGEPIRTFPYDVVQPCYGDVFRHRLPNASEVQLEDFRLETPAAAGERFAVSVRHQGKGPFDVEIWGTHEECGVAEELLWWGPMVDGIQCGEFVPSDSYSHLLYVYRKLRTESYSFSNPELGLCNAGSCPAGADGEGREPGVTPTGAPLVVRATSRNTHRRAFDLELGVYGRMVLLHRDVKQPKGTPNPIHGGFFRMPPDDRFGDAWYCVGDGSSIVQSAENDTYDVTLRDVTRLPSCANGAGTLSVRYGLDQFALTSSFDNLGSPNPYAVEQSCEGTFCAFLFQDYDTVESKHWIYLTPSESVGSYYMPTSTPTGVASAMLFHQATPDSNVEISCATSGSITYDPMAETHIDLEGMSDYFACPGEPIADDELEFTTIEP
jgi:hypothetical protein